MHLDVVAVGPAFLARARRRPAEHAERHALPDEVAAYEDEDHGRDRVGACGGREAVLGDGHGLWGWVWPGVFGSRCCEVEFVLGGTVLGLDLVVELGAGGVLQR